MVPSKANACLYKKKRKLLLLEVIDWKDDIFFPFHKCPVYKY